MFIGVAAIGAIWGAAIWGTIEVVPMGTAIWGAAIWGAWFIGAIGGAIGACHCPLVVVVLDCGFVVTGP